MPTNNSKEISYFSRYKDDTDYYGSSDGWSKEVDDLEESKKLLLRAYKMLEE